MSSSQAEKKDFDVEMAEASSTPSAQDAAPSLIAGFDSFRAKLAKRSAGKGSKRAGSEPPEVPTPLLVSPVSSPVPSAPLPLSPIPVSEGPSDALMVPEQTSEQVPAVQVHPSGSSTAPIVISGREDAIESTPPPREIVLGLPAASAAPLPGGKARATAASGIKRRRVVRNEECDLPEPLLRHRSKVFPFFFICLFLFCDDAYFSLFSLDSLCR